MTKQEVIQMHWIELNFEPCVFDENGYIDFDFLPDNFDISKLYGEKIDGKLMCRPKSLQGIETNNNWIKIESEDDLPKTRGNEDVFLIGFIGEEISIGSTKLLNDKEIRKYWLNTVKYYQPITKPQPPLY